MPLPGRKAAPSGASLPVWLAPRLRLLLVGVSAACKALKAKLAMSRFRTASMVLWNILVYWCVTTPPRSTAAKPR